MTATHLVFFFFGGASEQTVGSGLGPLAAVLRLEPNAGTLRIQPTAATMRLEPKAATIREG